MTQNPAPAATPSRLAHLVTANLGYAVGLHAATLGALALTFAVVVQPLGISEAFTRAAILAPLIAGIFGVPFLAVPRFRGRFIVFMALAIVGALLTAVSVMNRL